MIIDVHTHVFPAKVAPRVVEQLSQYYGLTLTGTGTIDDLTDSLHEGGVKKALIFSTATRVDQVAGINNYIAGLLSGTFFGFGTLHPDMEDVDEEIDRIVSLGLKGVKMHADFQRFYLDEDRMEPIYRALSKRKLPILQHLGDVNTDYSTPKRLSHVLDAFPELVVIGAHLGGYQNWDDVMKHLAGRKLYFDTSSALWCTSREVAVDIIRTHGVDNILFGTDYPITRHREELNLFYGLGLTKEENRKILTDNAARLFSLDV